MMFAIFELASSPKEQEKIREDMKQSIDTQYSYEWLNRITYIDYILNGE